MVLELAFRFLIGGALVCVFALIGEVLQPKTFAGIFGAAPSVALATLGLTLATHGGSFAGLEGRSMVVGAIALLIYSVLVGYVLLKGRLNTFAMAGGTCLVWLVVAFGLWGTVLR